MLWMVVRYFGVEGLRQRIRNHIRMGQEFASWIEESPNFELAAPAPFSTICFRMTGSDLANERLLERINASGTAFLSHTKLDGRFTLRFTVGNLRTTDAHVRAAWDVVQAAAR